MYDLLHDPLIPIDTPSGPATLNLPELMARLVAGEVHGYRGLRAHHADPWHVFLVQLAASVLARHADIDPAHPPDDAAFWRAGLLDLADGRESAWHLFIEDVTQPAFLQHPLRDAAEMEEFKPKAHAPDELDILVTSKDHDVKMARARPDDPQAWLYALMSYQTMSGYLGAGNYGTVRMQGGFASRPIVGMAGRLDPSPRFREELALVCGMRAQILQAAFGYRPRGVVLTWVYPWSRRDHQFYLHELEPWFIEAVRPLRMVAQGQGMHAQGSTSAARQIGPKALESGEVGDPWIPIATKKSRTALTLGAQGWTPERLADLLFEQNHELTALQKPRAGEGMLWFYGSVLVRGQGTTEGYHRFALPIPPKARGWLTRPEERQRLGTLAQELLKDAKAIAKNLRWALLALAEGGPEQPDFGRDALNRWVERGEGGFARHWQERFFPTLWTSAEASFTAVQEAWRADLRRQAGTLLRQAEQTLPLPHNRQYRAKVRAEGLFHALLHKAGLLPETERENAT